MSTAAIGLYYYLHSRGYLKKGSGDFKEGDLVGAEWTPCKDDQGRTYYYNKGTGETTWVKPESNSAPGGTADGPVA